MSRVSNTSSPEHNEECLADMVIPSYPNMLQYIRLCTNANEYSSFQHIHQIYCTFAGVLRRNDNGSTSFGSYDCPAIFILCI